MQFIKSILLLLLIAAVVVFILQNLNPVSLMFWVWQVKLSLSLITILFYLLGAVSGGLVLSLIKTLSFNTSKRDD